MVSKSVIIGVVIILAITMYSYETEAKWWEDGDSTYCLFADDFEDGGAHGSLWSAGGGTSTITLDSSKVWDVSGGSTYTSSFFNYSIGCWQMSVKSKNGDKDFLYMKLYDGATNAYQLNIPWSDDTDDFLRAYEYIAGANYFSLNTGDISSNTDWSVYTLCQYSNQSWSAWNDGVWLGGNSSGGSTIRTYNTIDFQFQENYDDWYIENLSYWKENTSWDGNAIFNGYDCFNTSVVPTPNNLDFDIYHPADNIIYYNENANITFNMSLDLSENMSIYLYNSSNILWAYYFEDEDGLGENYFNITFNNLTNDVYNYKYAGCNATLCENTSNYYLTVNSTVRTTFNFLNNIGEILGGVYVTIAEFGINAYHALNPGYIPFTRTFFNNSNESMSMYINVTDADYETANLNELISWNPEDNSTMNFTMQPIQLTLNFYQNDTGNPMSVSGEACEEGDKSIWEALTYMCRNFSSTSFIQVQSNLTVGNIKIVFNTNSTSHSDWLQYYEYYNNQSTTITENIDILRGDNPSDLSLVYYKVTDAQNRPIEGASIFSYHNTPYSNESFALMGRRLTADDGTTSFYYDDDTKVRIGVFASGYDPKSSVIYPVDEVASHSTKDTALRISLAKSTSSSDIGAWVGSPRRFWDRTEDITIAVVAPDWDSITYRTDYGLAQGEPLKALTNNGLFTDYEYYYTLISGTDFDATGTDDITISMVYDGLTEENITIEYFEKQDLFDFTDVTLSDDSITIVGAIVLVLVSALVGVWIASPTAGVTTFVFGGIVLALIDSSFLWLGIVNALLLIMYGVKKVFRE